jgi:hypothetical protein
MMTAPAKSVNAFIRSRTAAISFDFASTATCPRTAPMPCARGFTAYGTGGTIDRIATESPKAAGYGAYHLGQRSEK